MNNLRVTTVFILLLTTINLFAQNKSEQYCLTLTDIVEMPIFKSQFNLEQLDGLTLIDTSRFFGNCQISEVEGKKMQINNRMPSKDKLKNDNSIILLSMGYKFNNGLIAFGFLCPANGSIFSILYEVKDNGLELLGYKIGDN